MFLKKANLYTVHNNIMPTGKETEMLCGLCYRDGILIYANVTVFFLQRHLLSKILVTMVVNSTTTTAPFFFPDKLYGYLLEMFPRFDSMEWQCSGSQLESTGT